MGIFVSCHGHYVQSVLTNERHRCTINLSLAKCLPCIRDSFHNIHLESQEKISKGKPGPFRTLTNHEPFGQTTLQEKAVPLPSLAMPYNDEMYTIGTEAFD